jgi:uncharacterized protein (TIGR00369 family)
MLRGDAHRLPCAGRIGGGTRLFPAVVPAERAERDRHTDSSKSRVVIGERAMRAVYLVGSGMSDAEDARARLALKLVRGFSEHVPHNRALGLKVLEISKALAVFRLPYDEKLVGNPDNGVIHGGAITALIDGASGAAVFATLADFVPIATLDLRIDYLRPAEAGHAVTARAVCYKMTRNVAFTRAVAYHEDPDDPIAHSVGTFMVSTKTGSAKT